MKYKILIILILITQFAFGQKKYSIGQITTSYGKIWIWLYDETPQHKASFIQLAKAGYWDSLSFNRVIPNFVAQAGCPDTDAGFTDSAYLMPPEFHPNLQHQYGAVGAGRDDNPKMYSATCQFYIVQNKKGLARLDNKYTIFGKVIKGMEIIDTIVNVQRDKKDEPLQKITIDVNIIKLTKKKLKKMNFVIPSKNE